MIGPCPGCGGHGDISNQVTGALIACDLCKGSGSVQVEPDDPRKWAIGGLSEWWIEQARIEAAKLAPKAIEYGSYDLQLIGKVLADMLGREPDPELGILFYALGKVARIVSAYRDGLRPSDDTWADLAIYARMAAYLREHEGRWP